MNRIIDTLPILAAPLAACIVIALLHSYAGLHVLRRGVIFVDIALAQMAALGTVVGTVLHHSEHAHPDEAPISTTLGADADDLDRALAESGLDRGDAEWHEEHDEHSWMVETCTLGFAIGGAVLLAFGRVRGERVPHEAIIGIVYVVAAAVTVLILSKAPHGHEQMEAMLVGKLLYVNWNQVLSTAGLYAVLGVLHWIFRKPLLEISASPSFAEERGVNVRLWDCIFYGMFALMVTRSVEIGGVLVVFSYLIIPGTCAALFTRRMSAQLFTAWAIAILVSLMGLGASAIWDFPTGSALVATSGLALGISLTVAKCRSIE